MERISGIECDLEKVETEPMGHEWGDSAVFDDVYDLPFVSSTASEAGGASGSASSAPDVADFGVGTHDADPAVVFGETGGFGEAGDSEAAVVIGQGGPLGVETLTDQPGPGEPFTDQQAEHSVVGLAEIDPFDTFDEEFSQVMDELEDELPVLE